MMRGAVCYQFGQPLVVEELELDAPRSGEVRVRIAATAVCHSDVHLMRGDWVGPLPIVAGHEAAGVVEEIGPEVTSVQRGDRVVVSLLRSCGRCFFCAAGARHNCDAVFALDTESRIRNARGEALQVGIKVGAFAEEAIVDQSQVVRVPDELPLDRAALLGCGVITGIGAVFNTARVQAGENVVVIGTGGVGLNTIQGAALSGASAILAIDRVEAKLEAAQRFGATHLLNAAAMEPKELVRAVRKLTAGRGADYVFVTVGVAEAVASAQMMIRRGGTVVIVGMAGVRETAPIRIFDVAWSDQRIIGSRMGGTRLDADVPRLIELYLGGKLKLDELVSARVGLDDINDAIASMQTGTSLRTLIEM
jgi:Zn-dependent alcohol dehydrogenase